MKVDIPKRYIDEGLVSEREHPTEPYLIYNYTQECQFGKHWDPVTVMCRGLVLHKETKELIARPFSKFFNYEEHIGKGESMPNEVPKVYAKFDGSLGILYWSTQGEPMIATRGSFVSDQAIWATKFINRPDVRVWVDKLDRDYTHLFEIIYPENRIVVSYGWEGMVHLASMHKETGKSTSPDSDFPLASAVPFTSIEELKKLNTKNEEGFVLHFEESDMRVKIKFEDYVALHKIITGLSVKGIWEMLEQGMEKEKIIASVPDEMFAWVEEIVEGMCENFTTIEQTVLNVMPEIRAQTSRKDQAMFITKGFPELSGIAFAMLDEKDYKKIIWKMLRPVGSKTFRVDIDR